jgi:hypothetical protein
MTFMASPTAGHGARGRHRAGGGAGHRRRVIFKICVIAALVAGGLAATVPWHPAQAAAVNLLANPSFEQALSPWGGSHLARQATSSAPAGRWVAQVSAAGGSASIDDWPGEVRSQAGTGYDGRMSVAASAASSVGKRVTLVLREHTAAGGWVASWQSSAVLGRAFQQLSVHGTGVRTGDYLDLYAYQQSVAAGDAFLVDAAWLSGPATAGTTTPAAPSSTAPTSAPTTTAAPAPSSTAASSTPASTPTSTAPTSPSSVSTAPAPASGSSIAELSLDANQADQLGDTSKFRYVVLQDYMYSHIAAIKQKNPNTKVLAYLEAPVTRVQSCTGSTAPAYAPHDSFGVNYCYAAQSHPDWFLTDAGGRRLTYTDYPSYSMMDIGNAAYQQTWAANALNAAKADGFDGVYMDDVNTHPGHGMDGKVAAYADQAYGQAMSSFVASVGDRLRAGGLLAFANVSADPWTTWQRSDALAMAAHLTGVNREHYSRWGDICGPFSERFNTTANNGTPPIDVELSYDRAIQATGAYLMGIDYGYSPATSSDVATMTYGRAMFLLAWDGRAGSSYIFRPCGGVDPANPAWMTDLGAPSEAATQLADGVYERRYSAGLVLLNPSRTSSADVPVPAGYAASGTVTLGPETARLIPVG